jgi:hypothetical protein
VRDVTDRGKERGVDHRGSGTEQHRAECPDAEAGRRGNERDRGCLNPHTGRDEPFASDAIGPRAGEELPDSPHGGVQRGEDADARD